jgi:Na+-driven multidrug efflux pump
LGLFYVIQGGFRGSGDTRTAMVFAFLGFIVFRSAFAYALAVPGGFGATGVWYGEALANVLMALAVAGSFLQGSWAEGVIDDGDAAASA